MKMMWHIEDDIITYTAVLYESKTMAIVKVQSISSSIKTGD